MANDQLFIQWVRTRVVEDRLCCALRFATWQAKCCSGAMGHPEKVTIWWYLKTLLHLDWCHQLQFGAWRTEPFFLSQSSECDWSSVQVKYGKIYPADCIYLNTLKLYQQSLQPRNSTHVCLESKGGMFTPYIESPRFVPSWCNLRWTNFKCHGLGELDSQSTTNKYWVAWLFWSPDSHWATWAGRPIQSAWWPPSSCSFLSALSGTPQSKW